MFTPQTCAPPITLAALKFAVSDQDLFGQCDETLEVRLPSDLKDAVRRAAAQRKMKTGPWVRLVLANAALGQEHVLSVLAERVGMAPVPAPLPAPAVAPSFVRTTARVG